MTLILQVSFVARVPIVLILATSCGVITKIFIVVVDVP
jgi:hypothetical protein